MSTPATPDTQAPRRMTLSQVVERLTEKRGGSSSVTVKMSAQGVLMPEVTIAANEDDDIVNKMVEQAIRSFTEIVERATKGGDGK